MSSQSFVVRQIARLAAILLAGMATEPNALAASPEPRIAWIRQTRLVISPAAREVTIQVAIQGKVNQAQLYATFSPSPIPFNDTGRDGDRVASDGVYSLCVDAARIRDALAPADVLRAD